MLANAAKLFLIALLVFEGIPAGELARPRDVAHCDAAAAAASCKIAFTLGMQGPCDPMGPCRNPHHGHHGHQHPAKEAVPCPTSAQGRPAAAVLPATAVVPVSSCVSPGPAATDDRPWIASLPAPFAERAPPAATSRIQAAVTL